jgi:hypothetical protein
MATVAAATAIANATGVKFLVRRREAPTGEPAD